MIAALLAALAPLLVAPAQAPAQGAPPAANAKPQTPAAQAPAGQGQPAGGVAAPGERVPPIQDMGEFYTLYFEEDASGGEGLNLEQFVKLCQEATGINFTYTEATQNQLKNAKLKMFGPKTIPKSDFYSFFQIMMIINDFVCTKIGPDHLAVVLIQSLSAQGQRGGQTLKKDAVYVSPDELDRYADQPAVLIHTVVDLPHVDARQLSTSLRQMFPDQQTQSILPVSGSSLILTGFGSDVAAMVRMLQFVDRAAADQAVILPDFEMIPLEFASAEEVANTLTDLLEASRRATQARGAQVAQAQGATGALQTGQTESKIMVDARTNSLLVMAMPDDMPRIKELVARLDVDIVQGERTYHIYNLENVSAEELSETLDSFIRDAARVTPGGPARAQGGQAQASSAPSSQRNEIVVVADEATNSLLIAANRTRYEEVLDLIRRLDQRQDQVLIETALIELTGQDSFRLAVELGLAEISTSGDGGFGVSSFGLSTFEDTNGDGVPDIRMPNLFGGSAPPGVTAGIISGDDFSLPILINALQTRRDTNVLNVPSVLVNNNKSAKVTSKDEQPTTTITATGGGVGGQTQENFKEYVEAGITLEISPTISASRYLRLNISLEVSTFIGAVSSNGAVPPPKVTRTINTQVNVPDGDTMVIGGIITDNLGKTKSSVPWLGDIPIIGYLFSDTSESQSKTTLYFFVTPHIMRDRDFADLAEYSFKRKLEAADTIGAERVRVVDPTFGREQESVDMRGFEVPLYRGPQRGEVQDRNVGLDAKKLNEMLEQGSANNTPTAPPPAQGTPQEKP